jgi:uncharacterized cupredoxin-like copper-binding protein/Cu/Ag efflux protein CusF
MKHSRGISVLCLAAATGLAWAHSEDQHDKAGGAPSGQGHTSVLGKPGDPKKVNRTVEITMNDSMRFTPARVAAKRNETIRFVLKNEGKLKHEMVLGTIKELKAHAALMIKFPQMEHADPNQASVEPGKTGELIWQFTKVGTFDFACLQAGHYEAGMKGQVLVARASTLLGSGTVQSDVRTVGAADIVLAQAGRGEMADGEIRKVDKDTKKLTIKHGEIKNLDMPGMTMLFQVKDPAMLDMVKPGDKVRFRAEKAGGGIVVTEIQVAK